MTRTDRADALRQVRGVAIVLVESSYLAWAFEHCEHLRPELREAIWTNCPGDSAIRRRATYAIRRCPDPDLALRIVTVGLHVLARPAPSGLRR